MEQLEKWMKGAVYLYLMMHVLSQLAAKETYIRYLRFFCGLCFLTFFLSPVFSVLKEGDSLWERIEDNSYQQELRNWQQDMEKMEYLQGEYCIRQYEDKIAREAEELAVRHRYLVSGVQVRMDDAYQIVEISMTLEGVEGQDGALAESYRQKKKDALQSLIVQEYGVEKGVVQIE